MQDSAWEAQLELLQPQLGTVDVLETLASAYSPTGWLGGLDRIRSILSKYPNAFLEKLESVNISVNFHHRPIRCSVITSNGLQQCIIDDEGHMFGGDVRTQFMGFTICALAHESHIGSAIELFMGVLAPWLLEGFEEPTGTINDLLNENGQRIPSEGAARGLTEHFASVIAELHVPNGDRRWLRGVTPSEDSGPLPSELAMVELFLRRMTRLEKGPYFTRSGLVARVAACLKSIGYPIGRIHSLSGTADGDLAASDTDANQVDVILLVGGSSPNDAVERAPAEIVNVMAVLHYGYHTVGPMLLEALRYQSDVGAEVYQAEFERIYEYFESNLRFKYMPARKALSGLEARAIWRSPTPPISTAVATSLAEIYFPDCAERIARCYRRFTAEDAYDKILDSHENFGDYGDDFPEELSMFRAITAAIVVSVVSRLAPKDFKTMRHCTLLELSWDRWLIENCAVVNKALSHRRRRKGLVLKKVASLIAVVHAGAPDLEKPNSELVGWRHGIYAVLPSVLVEMDPSRDAVGMQCLDVFLGNVRVHANGEVYASGSSDFYFKKVDYSSPDLARSLFGPLSLPCPKLGPAHPAPPDMPISLSIGPPLQHATQEICLRAYSPNGSITTTGSTGSIKGLLWTLAASQDEAHACSHPTSPTDANLDPDPEPGPGPRPGPSNLATMPISTWTATRRSKLLSRAHVTFLPAQAHRSWTLFLAAQASEFQGRIVHRCVECALGNRSPPPLSLALGGGGGGGGNNANRLAGSSSMAGQDAPSETTSDWESDSQRMDSEGGSEGQSSRTSAMDEPMDEDDEDDDDDSDDGSDNDNDSVEENGGAPITDVSRIRVLVGYFQ